MGFLARTIRLLNITLKRLNLVPPSLVTFSFYLSDTFWRNFSKIARFLQLFKKWEPSKYLIFEFCCFSWKSWKWIGGGGYRFRPEKMFSGIKSDFFSSFARFQGVNIESRWLVPFWRGVTLWRFTSKSRKTNSFKVWSVSFGPSRLTNSIHCYSISCRKLLITKLIEQTINSGFFTMLLLVKSVQSTLSHLITTSVPRAMLTHFLVEHGWYQSYLYWIDLPGGWIT